MIHIKINEFLALKNVEFTVDKGITIIAGKNGCGKSQILLGLAQKNSKCNLMGQYGFKMYDFKAPVQISAIPEPSLVLFRPAIRKIAEHNRDKEFASMNPLADFFDAKDTHKKGYSSHVDTRYLNMYTILANLFVCGNLSNKSKKQENDWNLICKKFNNVFNKDLDGKADSQNGIKVGIKLDSKDIVSFNSLSTGELEFLALLCDLIIEQPNENEPEAQTADMILIDEIDAHFHPDLQRKIISEIEPLCKEKYVLITTHSPAVMMSVSQDRLFYLKHFSECKTEKSEQDTEQKYSNQIILLSQDSQLYLALSEMYKGFTSDISFARHFSNAQNFEIQKFADECTQSSEAKSGEKDNDYDPQINALASALLTIPDPTIAEFGCGRGRMLNMLKNLDADKLKRTAYYGLDIDEANLCELDKYVAELGLTEKGITIKINETLEKQSVDIFIFCNVLHEIPKILKQEINKALSNIKKDGYLYILEALSLAVGESEFMMIYPEALKILFASQERSGNLIFSCNSPKSYGGTKLMNACITVKKPNHAKIENADILKCIEKIIEIDSLNLKNYYEHKNLSSPQFAFITHNLANAIMYKNYYDKIHNNK